MKRILYIHHSVGMGGAPRSLAMLVAGLDRSRFKPIVAIPKRPGNEEVKSLFLGAGAEVVEEMAIRAFSGSEVSPCDTIKQKVYSILSFPLLSLATRRMVAELEPDLVHLNSTCMVASAHGAKLGKANCPSIAHVREPLLKNRWGRLLAWLNRRYVDYFISIDDAGLRSVGVDDRSSTVVRNFVDTQLYKADSALRAEERSGRRWKTDDVIFLKLARVSQSNGTLELIDLISNTHDQLHPRAKFVIAGFFENHTDYEKEAFRRAKAQTRCEVIGFTNNVLGLLNASDVIVAPFLTPHSARSVFEGGAIGKPALVSRLSNLMEQIKDGETGLAFDLKDSSSFVNGVNILSDADERQKMAQKALQFTQLHYSADRNVIKTQEVYDRLLGD